jgi:hypothetical protein
MAATKTRSPSGRANSKAKRSKSSKASTARKSSGKTRQRKASSNNGVAEKNGTATTKKARKAVESTAKQAGSAVSDAGHSVGKAARKAKTPLIAGSAAVAGAAGGLALGARQARKTKALRPKALRRPKVKIRSQDLARAARDVGQFGMDVGQLAGELRKNREAANGAKHRSPVEVVLDGLTHRKHDD